MSKKTKDYNLFVMNSMNRAVVDDGGYKPRPRLLKSMKKIGFSPVCAIKCRRVGDKLEIIDGHNRFVAAQFLGLDVYYEEYTEEETGDMNPLQFSVEQKAWNMRDVFQGYAHEGKGDYAEVLDYCNRTGIPVQIACSMFFGQAGSSNNTRDVSKTGDFKIRDRITPAIVADLITHINKFVPWGSSANLVIALSKCMYAEGFDPRTLKDKITKHSEMLSKRRTCEDYIELIEDVYNRFHKGDRYQLRAKVEAAMRKRNAAKRKA